METCADKRIKANLNERNRRHQDLKNKSNVRYTKRNYTSLTKSLKAADYGYTYVDKDGKESSISPVKIERSCLKCNNTFKTSNKFIRICSKCKSKISYKRNILTGEEYGIYNASRISIINKDFKVSEEILFRDKNDSSTFMIDGRRFSNRVFGKKWE